MKFTIPWSINPEFGSDPLPLMDIFFRRPDDEYERRTLLVDSGADVSMVPSSFAEDIGVTLRSGTRTTVRGISPKDECAVVGYIHPVEIHVLEARIRLVIPVCFARGAAPFLLGRLVFFDVFRIQFEQASLQTHFELVDYR